MISSSNRWELPPIPDLALQAGQTLYIEESLTLNTTQQLL